MKAPANRCPAQESFSPGVEPVAGASPALRGAVSDQDADPNGGVK